MHNNIYKINGTSCRIWNSKWSFRSITVIKMARIMLRDEKSLCLVLPSRKMVRRFFQRGELFTSRLQNREVLAKMQIFPGYLLAFSKSLRVIGNFIWKESEKIRANFELVNIRKMFCNYREIFSKLKSTYFNDKMPLNEVVDYLLYISTLKIDWLINIDSMRKLLHLKNNTHKSFYFKIILTKNKLFFDLKHK